MIIQATNTTNIQGALQLNCPHIQDGIPEATGAEAEWVPRGALGEVHAPQCRSPGRVGGRVPSFSSCAPATPETWPAKRPAGRGDCTPFTTALWQCNGAIPGACVSVLSGAYSQVFKLVRN